MNSFKRKKLKNFETEETEEILKKKNWKKILTKETKPNFQSRGWSSQFFTPLRERERGVEFQIVRRCRNILPLRISYPRLREPSIPFSIIEVSRFRYDSAWSRRSASLVNEAAIRLG